MSARSLRIRMLEAARQQVADILRYTEREWGEEQRRIYAQRIADMITLLASNPDAGRSRDDLDEGLRSYRFDSHVIFYWVEDDMLVVARVLHRRQRPTGDIR